MGTRRREGDLGDFQSHFSPGQDYSAAKRGIPLCDRIAAMTVPDIEGETTQHYAAIGLELKKKGRPIAANDLWIAALCRGSAVNTSAFFSELPW
jgi:hypothetical protein